MKGGPWLGALLALAAGVLAGHALLPAGFFPSHDGLLTLHRLFELERCIADGQLPCRWAANMGAGYGAPLFVFYPPLPTWIAELFRLLGAGLIEAIKLAFLLSFAVGALGAWLMARPLLGAPAALAAAVLFTWAPYRALDVYVRAALNEAWGLALLPFVFFTAERLLASRGRRAWRWALGAGLAWAALLLTHNLVSVTAAPVYVLWCLLLGWRERGALDRGQLAAFVAGHLLALGLAGFYWLPSLLEQRHVHIESLVSLYDWVRWDRNFLSPAELLWAALPFAGAGGGHGPFRQPNGMVPSLGPLFWLLGSAGGVAAIVGAARATRTGAAVQALAAGAWLAAWMTLPSSEPVWRALPFLAFLQFPWRFLGVAALGFAFAGAFCVRLAQARGPRVGAGAAAAIALAAIAGGWSGFAPAARQPVADERLANPRVIAAARHGRFDFMPRGVDLERFPAEPRGGARLRVLSGNARLSALREHSDRVAARVEVQGDAAVLRFEVFAYPGWRLLVDGKTTPPAGCDDDPLARLCVRVAGGLHEVEARFERTPLRGASEITSALSLLLALSWALVVAARPRAAG